MTTAIRERRPGSAVGNRLDAKSLSAVAEGRLRAIRVPEFFDPGYSQLTADRLIRSKDFGHYVNARDIGRVGMAYFESAKNPELRARYYANATAWIGRIREACWPHPSPMDLLRLTLEETWPAGATLENVDGRTMFVGLARVFESGAGALPHQDVLSRDADPGCGRATSLTAQLAANVYLRPSDAGGELEVWLRQPTAEEFDAIRLGDSYGADRGLIGEPDVVLAPATGDLIVFNSRNLHAVRPAAGGPRVTLSCFLGYRGPAHPLTYWS